MVKLQRLIVRARAGQFVFLSVPALGRLQSHPFTIIVNNPPKFIIDRQHGITSKLYETAIKQSEVSLNARVDGPYGSLPDFAKYDKVILIAGGTGATFTFVILGQLLEEWAKKEAGSNEATNKRMVEFVWVVRKHCSFQQDHFSGRSGD